MLCGFLLWCFLSVIMWLLFGFWWDYKDEERFMGVGVGLEWWGMIIVEVVDKGVVDLMFVMMWELLCKLGFCFFLVEVVSGVFELGVIFFVWGWIEVCSILCDDLFCFVSCLLKYYWVMYFYCLFGFFDEFCLVVFVFIVLFDFYGLLNWGYFRSSVGFRNGCFWWWLLC